MHIQRVRYQRAHNALVDGRLVPEFRPASPNCPGDSGTGSSLRNSCSQTRWKNRRQSSLLFCSTLTTPQPQSESSGLSLPLALAGIGGLSLELAGSCWHWRAPAGDHWLAKSSSLISFISISVWSLHEIKVTVSRALVHPK